MELDLLESWLRAVDGFNDFELGLGEYGDLEGLLRVKGLRDGVYPLGFHGSGSWVALWRREVQTPWSEAAMVWIDSEGSPWEAFAATPAEGLSMLSLDTGTLYDALSAAEAAAGHAAAEAAAHSLWEERTPRGLASAAARYERQREHRSRLARAKVSLPRNAFDVALGAFRKHGRFSSWLSGDAGPRTAPVEVSPSPAEKAKPKKKASARKPSTGRKKPRQASDR